MTYSGVIIVDFEQEDVSWECLSGYGLELSPDFMFYGSVKT